MVGLSGCGAPAYSYVADSAAGAYYKVPYGWHQISQHDLNAAIGAPGASGGSFWSSAFDAGSLPSAAHLNSPYVIKPFVFSEVTKLSSTVSNALSYNVLRDFTLPVTSSLRQQYANSGFPLTNFTQLRDQTITAKQGVHGVREIFQYTFPGGISDTYDEVVLTNADQTIVYLLLVHCTNTCYTQNQREIDTIMSSFTVGSPA